MLAIDLPSHRLCVRTYGGDVCHYPGTSIQFALPTVMDYAPHGSLRQRHPRGTLLPLPIVVSYVQQIADALQYAHD